MLVVIVKRVQQKNVLCCKKVSVATVGVVMKEVFAIIAQQKNVLFQKLANVVCVVEVDQLFVIIIPTIDVGEPCYPPNIQRLSLQRIKRPDSFKNLVRSDNRLIPGYNSHRDDKQYFAGSFEVKSSFE